jgi:hypothetical protein
MEDKMNITSVYHTTDPDGNNMGLKAIVDGDETFIPISEGNRHYAEIMRQVNAGELTIADAD